MSVAVWPQWLDSLGNFLQLLGASALGVAAIVGVIGTIVTATISSREKSPPGPPKEVRLDELDLYLLMQISTRPKLGIDREQLSRVAHYKWNLDENESGYHIASLTSKGFIRQEGNMLFLSQNGMEYIYSRDKKRARRKA